MALVPLAAPPLERRDILMAEQGLGPVVARTRRPGIGVDFMARSARKVDGRRGRRPGPGDWLVPGKKGHNPSAVRTPEEWAQGPQEVTVRSVRGRLCQPGLRMHQVTRVTPLLDPGLDPAAEMLRASLRRGRLEMGLDDLKTTLGMETLRCQQPAMVEKEVLLPLIAHNLIRWLMLAAAPAGGVELERISFKGTVDALPEFSQAIAQARSARKRQALWESLLHRIAADLLPDRPGRREPRAVKRQHKKDPPLTTERHKFRDLPKRHDHRKNARLCKPSAN